MTACPYLHLTKQIRACCLYTSSLQSVLIVSLSATSIVAAPHCGDRSFSVENEIDEISATGGHRFHSHSTRSNAFGLISVVPVTLRDFDYSYSTYSIGSTGFCYHFVINLDNSLSAVEWENLRSNLRSNGTGLRF